MEQDNTKQPSNVAQFPGSTAIDEHIKKTEETNSAEGLPVVSMLKQAAADIEAGRLEADKALLILVNTEAHWDIGWRNANMMASEAIVVTSHVNFLFNGIKAGAFAE